MHTFQWNAVDYAASSGIQQQWARELIGKLNFKGNEILLDIGSGDGKVTAEIAGVLPEGSVTGIDSSDEMVKLAQRTFPAGDFMNLRFMKMDAADLRFGERFDVIFSNATLHWVYDHRPVLAGIERSLKPGGKILLQMGGYGNAADVMDIIDQMREEEEWKKYFEGFNFSYGFHKPDSYRKWLVEAGLRPERVELILKDAVHNGQDGLESWIRTTWLPYTHRVPEEKRGSFIRQLSDGYLRRFPFQDDGTVHVKMVRLEVEAGKI
jgi:trans-aconitate 2-methyltransferase